MGLGLARFDGRGAAPCVMSRAGRALRRSLPDTGSTGSAFGAVSKLSWCSTENNPAGV